MAPATVSWIVWAWVPESDCITADDRNVAEGIASLMWPEDQLRVRFSGRRCVLSGQPLWDAERQRMVRTVHAATRTEAIKLGRALVGTRFATVQSVASYEAGRIERNNRDNDDAA